MLASRFAENRRPAHVGLDESERIHQRAVDVCLRREVDDGVRLGGKGVDQFGIADVAMDEAVARLAFEVHQVGQVPRVRELVEHRDLDVGPRGAQVADKVGTNESRAARDQEALKGAGHLIAGPVVQS